MTRSPYLRDRLAEMTVFRARERPLPMSPTARCSQATANSLPRMPQRDAGFPLFLRAMPPLGSLAWLADGSILDGIIEIDGTRITLDELLAACEGP